jgi:signal transduction histidine kinase/Na+/proline symporter
MTMFDTSTVVLAAASYFLLFYLVAWITDKGYVPTRIINHPALYVLSLGVVVSTWSFYTALISASSRGYGFNAYYIGYAAAFLFAPILMRPILQITRTYQLASLADLFAFRFRSPWAGTLTTAVLLLCIFPLLALQILAVTLSTTLIAPAARPQVVAVVYTLVIILFTLRFGTQDVTGRERSDSIVVSIAFESIVKILALLVAGLYAVYGIFGGFNALNEWLKIQPPANTRLDISFLQNTTNLLVLLFFTAAIAMPHMFHMIFHENRNPKNLAVASWGVPLFLLLASLPVLPILWAFVQLGSEGNVQFAALLIGLLTEAPLITLIIYTGGVAAACGMMIVLAMSVSSMCLNHLLLRVKQPPAGTGLYQWLLSSRRFFIIGILAGGYYCYSLIADGSKVLDMGNISFIASVQFLPGILTVLYWPTGNSKGFIAGVLAGVFVWSVLGLLPMLFDQALFDISYSAAGNVNWNLVAAFSLITNLCVLVLVSLLTTTSKEERRAARLCAMDTVRQPSVKHGLVARTPAEFINRLSGPLGETNARREVHQAMRDLNLQEQEARPYHMQRLRTQLEANLSSLLGPTIAHHIIEIHLPFIPAQSEHASINFIETQVETFPQSLSGIALDLDALRRHHRQVLQNLPLGVCSIDGTGMISIWNTAMAKLTGLSSERITGLHLTALPSPWKELLNNFIADPQITHIPKHALIVQERQRWLSLHKSNLAHPMLPSHRTSTGLTSIYAGQVILVEDQTETGMLEAELAHAERLSSVGRLAAGVAHEIGNPVTGIACLAQNLRDETMDEEQREMAEQIIQQTHRISAIVQSLVGFSHSGMQADLPSRQELVNLYGTAAEAIQLLALQQDDRGIRFNNLCDPALSIIADHQRIMQVLLNLLTNARDASPDNAMVDVTNSSNADQVSLAVTDWGSGIPENLQNRVFEPFFTTKDPGKGTGLGLSLVHRIVSDLGGSIIIESPLATGSNKGTRVIVTFPCYAPR